MLPRRNWYSPPPPLLPQASVPLPPATKGGEEKSPAGEGLGESQFRRLEEKVSSLPTLLLELSLALNEPPIYLHNMSDTAPTTHLSGKHGQK